MSYGITQFYLTPDRGDVPAITPAVVGTRFAVPLEGSRPSQHCARLECAKIKSWLDYYTVTLLPIWINSLLLNSLTDLGSAAQSGQVWLYWWPLCFTVYLHHQAMHLDKWQKATLWLQQEVRHFFRLNAYQVCSSVRKLICIAPKRCKIPFLPLSPTQLSKTVHKVRYWNFRPNGWS